MKINYREPELKVLHYPINTGPSLTFMTIASVIYKQSVRGDKSGIILVLLSSTEGGYF